jgi:hypothetical protein
MVLTFFVVWGCIGWGIVCYCAVKAGARRHAMESALSASYNRQSNVIMPHCKTCSGFDNVSLARCYECRGSKWIPAYWPAWQILKARYTRPTGVQQQNDEIATLANELESLHVGDFDYGKGDIIIGRMRQLISR